MTTNCGKRVEHLGEDKLRQIYAELEQYGVRHEDPYTRNVTYDSKQGRFCLIDFEFATLLDALSLKAVPATIASRKLCKFATRLWPWVGVARGLEAGAGSCVRLVPDDTGRSALAVDRHPPLRTSDDVCGLVPPAWGVGLCPLNTRRCLVA